MLFAALPDGFYDGLVGDLLEYGACFLGEPSELLAVGLLGLSCKGVAYDLLDVGAALVEGLYQVAGGVYLDGLRQGFHRINLDRGGLIVLAFPTFLCFYRLIYIH